MNLHTILSIQESYVRIFILIHFAQNIFMQLGTSNISVEVLMFVWRALVHVAASSLAHDKQCPI